MAPTYAVPGLFIVTEILFESFQMSPKALIPFSHSSNPDTDREYCNFLHAALNHAGYFFLKNVEHSGTLHGVFLQNFPASWKIIHSCVPNLLRLSVGPSGLANVR